MTRPSNPAAGVESSRKTVLSPLRVLEGQVAIVTGSARGIGRAIAELLAAAGARVVINGIDDAAVRSADRGIEGNTMPVPGDITDCSMPEGLVTAALESWGRLDIVVNNAGYNWDSALDTMSDEQLQAMLDVHVVAPFRLLRAAAPHLLDQPRTSDRSFRKVVNISSVSGTMGNPDQANYNAAKAGLVGLTKGLAKEWGARGVNVNAVAPGFIDTRLTQLDNERQTISRVGRTIALGIPEHRRRQGFERVPLGRPGIPREVADLVLFLCSPASSYVHGQVLHVTGGLTIGMSS